MTLKEKAQAKVRARQRNVLAFIRENGTATTKEVIARFGPKGSMIGGIVGQLVKQGEIVGLDTGQRTRNGNPIKVYAIAAETGEEARITPQEDQDEFLLDKFFPAPAWTPPAGGVARRHVCK